MFYNRYTNGLAEKKEVDLTVIFPAYNEVGSASVTSFLSSMIEMDLFLY